MASTLKSIAIGGAINTRPASTLISYTFVGFIVFLVLSALGEVASFSPEPTTLHSQANRFCGPSLGFTLGWIYWLKYMMVIINQMTAGVVVISYWTTIRVGGKVAYLAVFLAVITSMNYWSRRFLGRYEVLLSSFKVLMVFGLMILSLVLALGGGPDHEKKGFRYWRWPGAFANDEDKTSLGIFRAIFRTFPSTTLSYLGTELIGMAVLHTQDSQKAAARVIHQTFYRILAFNLVIVTLLGMAIPYDEDILALPIYTSKRSASAFVVAVQMAHVRVLPDILNACILIFVVSAASRALCMATRIIRELSLEHNAPICLHHTDKRGVPVYALAASCAPALVGFLNLLSISGRLWSYLVNLVTMFSILTWLTILVMHIQFVRFCKAHQVPPNEIAFRAPFGIAGSWVALVLCVSIPIMRAIELSDRNFYREGLDIGAFVTSFLGIPLYIALVVGSPCHHLQPETYPHLYQIETRGHDFTRIIANLNEQFSLDIPNPRLFSPSESKRSADNPLWRCYRGLQRLYYDKTVDLNSVLNSFEEWVCSRNAGDAMRHWDGVSRARVGRNRNGGGNGRAVILHREREERMSYLMKLIDDELYLLSKGSFPRVREDEDEDERELCRSESPVLNARPLKRRFSTEDETSDEYLTAPDSPEKDDGVDFLDDSRKITKTTDVLKEASTFVERLTAGSDKSRRYDAVPAAQAGPNFSFSTFNTNTPSFAGETRDERVQPSFISTITYATDAVTDSGSYDDSVVAHLLTEDVTFTQDTTSSSISGGVPHYSAEGDIQAELLQVPMLYRYELERIGRAWNVPLNRMLAGDSISLSYNEFWKWIERHSQRNGKPVPEKPTRKAWDAACGAFRTDKHSEAVVLTGDLEWCAKSEPGVLKLRLNPLKTERSCRFHRRFGSDRFLSLTVPAPSRPPSHLRLPSHPALLRESIALWLTQNTHECLGRVWQPFYVEEVKQKRKVRAEPKFRVDFFAVDGKDFVGRFAPSSIKPAARSETSDSRTPMTLGSLLDWHLAPRSNSNQTNLKLFQRMSLGLSKTFATVVLKPKQVVPLADPPGHRVMNDGCALMSRQLANKICDSLGITSNTPSAFQGRIAGAKGLWMVDAHQSQITTDDDLWIQISDSQLKINPHPQDWQEPVDDEKLTFEVVKWSKPPHPVDLNIQLLAILDHGGHVKDYIADLARLGIQGVARDFEEVLKCNSPILCRSLAQKIRPTSDSGAGFMMQSVRRLEQWMTDDVEAIIRFSEAGFAPRDFYPLRKRLGRCLRNLLERYVEEMRIEVPLSTYAFCIADPYGVLKEDEVHFGLSINWRDEQGQFEDNLLDGIDVLVGRLPAHLPSDIQRRRAVWKPELRHFKDIIVFPTKGEVPLADMLSGGDYDGDTPWICWDQNIVRNFYNSNPPSGSENYPPEHFGLTKHSVPMEQIESMGEFLESSFTFNLTMSNLGRCTVEHEKLSYDESLDSQSAKELSFLLSHLVDGRKAGVHLSEPAWQKYRKKISPRVRELPAYKTTERRPKRDNIIDYIRFEVSHSERKQMLTNFQSAFPEAEHLLSKDEDLVRPWDEAREVAEVSRGDGNSSLYAALKQFTREIDDLNRRWNQSLLGGTGSFSPLAQEAAEQARAIPPPAYGDHPMILVWRHSQSTWYEVLASYAYKKQPQSSFVIYAFGEVLCQIKSRSAPFRTVSNEILACYRVNKKVIARLKVLDGEEEEESESVEYEGHEAIEAMPYGTTGVGGYYDPDDRLSVE
ncbi:RNA dependent RNA polymerase-domain-containing protein [Aspergillus crustosus]